MYSSNLNLQPSSNNQNLNQKDVYANITNVRNAQTVNNLLTGIDEGEFVLVGVNSMSAKFTPPKPQPQYDFGKMGKRSATSQYTLVRNAEVEKAGVHDVVADAVGGAIFGALFPGLELIEMLNHGRESFEKINEGLNKNITIQETKNINPVDAINPSKAFLPVTPFYVPTKPEPLLWDRVRAEKIEKTEKAKKQNKRKTGLGSF